MDRRVLGILLAMAAACALLFAGFAYGYGSTCFGWVQHADPNAIPGSSTNPWVVPTTAIDEQHAAFCRSKETALWLEIGATVLLGLAVITWTRKAR